MYLVALTLLTSTLAATPTTKPGSADIMAGADARIQKHRTGEVVLRVVDADGKPIASGTKLHIEQTRHAFLFGCNIFMLNRLSTPAENEAYAKYFAELLNYATLPFYWWAYEPQRGQPNYADTERVLKWCTEHGVTPKGHPLAWNFVDPAWLPEEPKEVMRLQLERIEAITSRFKDIRYWDVVNEAAQFERSETRDQAHRLTAAIRAMGVPAYLRAAFEAARRGNPDAKLIINDYRTQDDYIDVIRHLTRDNGKRLYDIIGIQCHQHGGPWGAAKTWEICERFKGFGAPLHFTEATLLSGQKGWELKKQSKDPKFVWASTPDGEARQARRVVEFYTVLFSHPSVEAITWWDFADKGAWQAAPAGFLRADLTPKPAYDALKGLIKGKWWTRTEAVTTTGGEARARGFFGDYQVTTEVAGRRLSGTFNFNRDTSGAVEVRLK